MILCHCAIVTDRQVTDAMDDGQVGLGAICRVTGAGNGCGQCVPSVRSVMRRYAIARAAVLAESAVTPLAQFATSQAALEGDSHAAA